MDKRLKIQFWVVEKALVMQVLEQKGLPKNKEVGNVWIKACPHLTRDRVFIRGSEKSKDFTLGLQEFESNKERDDYLKEITDEITFELFPSKGNLEIGKLCEVSENNEDWYLRELLAILPKDIDKRYVCREFLATGNSRSWDFARPLETNVKPIISVSGNVITYIWVE